MPRSLGSVYGGAVTRFLGGLRGVVSRVIATPGVCGSIAVSRDGSSLLVSDCKGGSHAVHEYSVADGSLRRVIGGAGDGPLQFRGPRQVYIAPDDFVFVADCGNGRVQVLTPSLDFHGFVGVGQLRRHAPTGVCASDDVIVVSEPPLSLVTVFSRSDGAVLRRFGGKHGGPGELGSPSTVCLLRLPRDLHIAVADDYNHHVSVFTVDGEYVRDVRVHSPAAVAGTACGELVIADASRYSDACVAVFDTSGVVGKTLRRGRFAGVAIHGGRVFAMETGVETCSVLVFE
jgi:hypothetical protein